jgi:hypothetical protein
LVSKKNDKQAQTREREGEKERERDWRESMNLEAKEIRSKQ